MHSVLNNDSQKIEEGKIIQEALSQGIGGFTPDLFFEKLVKNYKMTRKLIGESLIRYVSGYDPAYIEKNLGIPEFVRHLKECINKKIRQLRTDGVIDKQGAITETGIELSALVLYIEELDTIVPHGIQGERIHKKNFSYGDKEWSRLYKKDDRYRDIDIRKSAKASIRRGHRRLELEDLRVFERKSKGACYIIYGLDASGSMLGEKIKVCKKAGVALAYRALQQHDSVGLIVFGTDIKEAIAPTRSFNQLLTAISRVHATAETNIAATIKKSIELFPTVHATKHLLLLTDALPTKGVDPQKETIEAAGLAAMNHITISLVGINLDDQGKQFAQKIVEVGHGKLYVVRNLNEVDKIVLEDYYRLI
ncbi:VWA domain-containing protein [Candidatus Woesearchaeota archaeon]|nr:VWA domain-containing protein [Candidatus Woesearchaeota archaeon]